MVVEQLAAEVLHTAAWEAEGATVDMDALLGWMEEMRSAAPEVPMFFLDVSDEFARVHFENSAVELSSQRAEQPAEQLRTGLNQPQCKKTTKYK